jgi:hypothetical protein
MPAAEIVECRSQGPVFAPGSGMLPGAFSLASIRYTVGQWKLCCDGSQDLDTPPALLA